MGEVIVPTLVFTFMAISQFQTWLGRIIYSAFLLLLFLIFSPLIACILVMIISLFTTLILVMDATVKGR